MKRQKRGRVLVSWIFCFVLTVGLVSMGWAADVYPSKPITFQVHSAAGGSTDVGMRLLFATAEKIIGQPIPVTNKPGAGGVLAATTLMRAKPDGYFIGSWISPTNAVLMLDQARKVGFSPSDFTFIANHVYDPNVLCVRPDSPFKTMDDLIKAAKAQPGKISVGVTTKFGDDHLLAIDLQRRAGVKFNIISMDSSAPLRAAVLGGHVQVYVGNQGDTQPTVKEGLFRYLAFADTKRSPQFKDVPTMMELGYPLVGASARGIAGPKGIPKEVVAVLEAAIKKATEDPEHIGKMEKMGLPIRFLGSKEYGEFLAADYKRMEELLPVAMQEK